jgi:hypothetical protein
MLFGQTSWQTGRWKGWGLGWAGPGKTAPDKPPQPGLVFPKPGNQGKTADFAIFRFAFPTTGLLKP